MAVQDCNFTALSSWLGILMRHCRFLSQQTYVTLHIGGNLTASAKQQGEFVGRRVCSGTAEGFNQAAAAAAHSPESELLHLVVFLVSEDIELEVELSDERLAVLQVAGQLSLALHRLAALCSRHVLQIKKKEDQIHESSKSETRKMSNPTCVQPYQPRPCV